MRRIIIVAVVLFILAGFSWGGYALYRKLRLETRDGAITPPAASPTSVPPPAGLTRVLAGPLAGFWLNQATGELFSVGADGIIFRSALGKTSAATKQPIETILDVLPSPNGLYALIHSGETAKATFILFDAREGTLKTLPAGITSAAWNPESDRLAFLEEKNGTSTLYVLNIREQTAQEIVPITALGFSLEWVRSGEIYLIEPPSALTLGSLWSLNLETKTIQSLIRDVFGLLLRWSEDGVAFVRSSSNIAGSELTLIAGTSTTATPRKIPFMTIATKCAFSTATLLCGVPRNLSSETVLPDDYLKRRVYTEDSLSIWQYEATTTPTFVEFVNPIIDIERPVVNKNKDKLYFLNRYDRSLYSFDLKK